MSGGRPEEPPAGDERRAHPRHRVELRARVSAEGQTVDAATVDLSEGGVLLGGDDFPTGAVVHVEIELAEMGWHTLDAEVVRREEAAGDPGRLAARFAEVATGGGREAIRAFLEARLHP